jgi:hypothetical protein
MTEAHKSKCRVLPVFVWVTALSVTMASLPDVGSAAGIFGQDQHDTHGTFRLGVMNYTKSDGKSNYTGSASVLNYEYSRFIKYNQALVLGFRQATDASSKRDAYHAAYGGFRMYPLGVGFPLFVSSMDSTISYDAKFKPFGEMSLGLGRALLEAGEEGADYSSDSLSIGFGGGLMMHFFTRWAVDLQLMYEMVQGRGGSANSIMVSGNNIYILLGSGVLF